MQGSETGQVHYPMVEFVLDAIARWINKYRNMHGARDELEHCSQEDVMRIARDLGLSVSDLRGLAAKGPGAAETLQKMLLALSVDPQSLPRPTPP